MTATASPPIAAASGPTIRRPARSSTSTRRTASPARSACFIISRSIRRPAAITWSTRAAPTPSVGDGGVWSGSLTGPFPATPTLVATVGNINGLGPQGLEIQHAPTLTGTGNGGLAVTEASSAPNSGETTRVDVFSSLTASDIDTAGGDELRGAVVRVSGNFVFEAASTATGHTGTVDFLRINNLTSGTIAGSGITFTYDQTTGVMVLTGVATVAEYAAALDLVQFSTSGDNVTNDGNALTRTISASVFDGLLYSDEITATVTVTGINDAPVNTLGAAMNFTEDTTGTAGSRCRRRPRSNAITGISVFDVDADPTTEDHHGHLERPARRRSTSAPTSSAASPPATSPATAPPRSHHRHPEPDQHDAGGEPTNVAAAPTASSTRRPPITTAPTPSPSPPTTPA